MIKRWCPICGAAYRPLHQYVREFDANGPEVVQCLACGLVFLSPCMDKSEYTEFYNRDGQAAFIGGMVREDHKTKVRIQTTERLSRCRKYLINKHILIDVGCGYSDFISAAGQYVTRCIGIDPSTIRSGFRPNVINGTIHDWPEKNQVDIVTAFQVLEHILDPIDFMINVYRRLKDDGVAILEVPNHNDLLVNLPRYRKFYYQNAHCSYFTPRTLKNLLYRAGFKKAEFVPIQRYSLSNHVNWMVSGKPGCLALPKPIDGLYSMILRHTTYYDTIFVVVSK